MRDVTLTLTSDETRLLEDILSEAHDRAADRARSPQWHETDLRSDLAIPLRTIDILVDRVREARHRSRNQKETTDAK